MNTIQCVDGGGRQTPHTSSLEDLERLEVKFQGLEDLRIVWDSLFPFKFMKDEYVQLDYDNNGDKRFTNSVHIKTFEELVEFVKKNNGKCNIAISPNTRKPINGLNRRTGGEAILRQKAILIDIEDKNNHKLTNPAQVREMIDEAIKNMPEDIQKAVKWTAYTGGGGLICIELDRIIDSVEISILFAWLKRVLKGVKFVDDNALNPSQALRLIGTLNVKYGKPAKTFLYKANDNHNNDEALKVDKKIETELRNVEKEIERRNASEVKKHRGYIENLESVIKEIKEKVRFEDVFDWPVGNKGGHYTSYNCRFHPPDIHPSFVVWHNSNGDLAKDYHDNRYYDIIGLYMEHYKVSFIDAVENLANLGGIQLIYSKKNKKEGEKMEALSSFNAYEYVENELCIKKVNYWNDEEGYYLEITAENNEGGSVSFTIPAKTLDNYKSALLAFFQYTFRRPQKLPKGAEEELWEKVIEVIHEKSERVDMGDAVEEKLDVIKQEINAGRITNDLNDFLSTSLNLKFEKDGKTYIQLSKLLNKLKARYKVFNDLKQSELQRLLRKLGAEPVRYGHKAVRLWVLPSDGDGAVLNKNLGVSEENIDRQGKEENADTLTSDKNLGVSAQNIDRQGKEENADTLTPLFDETKNFENDDKNKNFEVKNFEKSASACQQNEENIDREWEEALTVENGEVSANNSKNEESIDNQWEEALTPKKNSNVSEEDDDELYPETF